MYEDQSDFYLVDKLYQGSFHVHLYKDKHYLIEIHFSKKMH